MIGSGFDSISFRSLELSLLSVRRSGALEVTAKSSATFGVSCFTVSLGRLFLSLLILPFFIFLCTILRPQDTTPRIACDSKSPMTNELGPLVRPRFPIRYLLTHAHSPAPCGLITPSCMFSCFLSWTHVISLFDSILFYSVLSHL